MTVELKTLKLKPMGNRVIVSLYKPVETMINGIVIPADSSVQEDKRNKGTVVAVGPGLLLEDGTHRKPLVGVGDVVGFSRFSSGEPYIEDGEHYSIFRDSDFIGTF